MIVVEVIRSVPEGSLQVKELQHGTECMCWLVHQGQHFVDRASSLITAHVDLIRVGINWLGICESSRSW